VKINQHIAYRIHVGIFMLMMLFCPLLLNSQEIISLDASDEERQIGQSVYYIEDPKDELTFADILAGTHDGKFKKCEQEAPNFGNVQLTTWNKFTVINNSDQDWMLLVGNYSLDSLAFYYPAENGSYQSIQSGRRLPISQRQYKTSVYAFDVNVVKGDTVVFYLKVSSFFMQYPMTIITKEKFVEVYHGSDMFSGFYYGFMILIIVYNLFLYFSLKDVSHLYYIFYVICNGLMIAQLKGHSAELWGDTFHFLWKFSPAIIAVASYSAFVFTHHILETKKNAPKLHKFMLYFFPPVYILIIILSIADHNLIASLLNQVVGMIALVTMSLTAIVVYRKGVLFARFYIAACCSYFAGIVIYVMKAFTILPFTTFTNNAIEVGSSVQLLMFAFTLADKVNLFKKEKRKAELELVVSLQENERLITEQSRILEVKVDERTRELQQTLGALEVSRKELEKQNVIVSAEKARSDKLLLNILPEEVADELKNKGSAEAKHFDAVTVMFTDFKNFTAISEKLSPTQLVGEVHRVFTVFDQIITNHNLEKIKTIGDAYMCAGGIPVSNTTHAVDVVNCALDLQKWIEENKRIKQMKGELFFEIRIGIHTGPVVAGIVGSKKFAYDIWGDTVNVASRMETGGETGRVNISQSTYELVRARFKCIPRGKIQVKNKGEVEMYFVEG
jgi:class 3 adenylate cyclase